MACPHCTKPRSPADHRRFFGLIGKAFDNWPEAHAFQPDDAEHLRAWLLCKAGYRESVVIPLGSDDAAVLRTAVLAVTGALKAAEAYAFVAVHADGLAVHRAKSINWATLDQKRFGPLREAVEEVIEAETGIPATDILREVSHG